MNEEIKNKLIESGIPVDILQKLDMHANLPVVEELQAIRKALETLASKESPQMEMPEKHQVEIVGAEKVVIEGKPGKDLKFDDLTSEQKDELRGEDGKNYVLTPVDKKEIAKSIPVPIVEKIIEKTEVIHEQPIITNEIKEVALADTAEDIRNKLELLDGDERLDKKAIKGLDDEIGRLDKKIESKPAGGGGGRQLRAASFSFAGDNSTTSFYLPTEPSGKGWFIFAHYEGQWLQQNVHYTVAGKLFNTLGGTSTFTPQSGTVIEGFVIY